MTAENKVIPIGVARRRRDAGPDRLFSIKEVSDQCGLPGPVIAQLVSRTWTEQGWMYTAEQVREAIHVAVDLRRRREMRAASAQSVD